MGVIVSTTTGVIYKADAVVCTLPLGVLSVPPGMDGHVTFDPPLPPCKRSALNRLGYGSYNKCALTFRRKFWLTEHEFVGVVGCPVAGGSVLMCDVGRAVGTTSPMEKKMDKSNNVPVIVITYGGSYAKAVESLSDREVVSECMNILRRVWERNMCLIDTNKNREKDKNGVILERGMEKIGKYEFSNHSDDKDDNRIEKGYQFPDPIDYVVTRWGMDRFARGSFSYVPPGVDGFEERGILSDPIYYHERKPPSTVVPLPSSILTTIPSSHHHSSSNHDYPIILFAGEATTPFHPSTIHGAYLSGIREALRLDLSLCSGENGGINFDKTKLYQQTFDLQRCLKVAKANGWSKNSISPETIFPSSSSCGSNVKRRFSLMNSNYLQSNTSASRPPSLSIVNSCNNRVNSVIASGTSSSSVVSTDQIVSPKSHNQNRLEQCTNIPLDREGTINFDKKLSCEKFSTTEDTAILRGAQTFGVDNPGIKLIHSLMFPIPILDGNCHRREGKRNEAKKINMTEIDLHLRYKELKKRIDIVVTSKLKEHVERNKNIESGNRMKTVVKPSIVEHRKRTKKNAKIKLVNRGGDEEGANWVMGGESFYEVEKITGRRTCNIKTNDNAQKWKGKRKREDPRIEYLVKWRGYPASESTWEPAESLPSTALQMVQAYDAKVKKEDKPDDSYLEVEEITEHRTCKEEMNQSRQNKRRKKETKKPKIEYLVKWKGYPSSKSTWEPSESLRDTALDTVLAYDAKVKNEVKDDDTYLEVEEIMEHRTCNLKVGQYGQQRKEKKKKEEPKFEYLVKWKGYPVSESTWEPSKSLRDTALQIVEAYEANIKKETKNNDIFYEIEDIIDRRPCDIKRKEVGQKNV